MIKKVFLIFIITLLFVKKVFAVCPVCTVAVGAGVGLAQYLGIDDAISGIWIGALTVSMALWTISWYCKKYPVSPKSLVEANFKTRWIVPASFVSYYILVVVPLFFMKSIFHPFNNLLGINKLILGIIVGSIIFLLSTRLYEYMRIKNGKAHFPFEKIVIPIFSLSLISFLFYLITR